MTKIALVACILGALSLVGSCFVYSKNNTEVESHIRTQFIKWRLKYNKIYKSIDEFEARLKVFRDNYYKIEEIRKSPAATFTVGLNKFADVTDDEFSSMIASSPKIPNKQEVILSTENLPNRVDWREKGAVTPVIDQGICGSSIYHAIVGTLECFNKVVNGKLVRLSVQQIVDCSNDWGNFACNGGFVENTAMYTVDQGLESADDYPYTGQVQECAYDRSKVVVQNFSFVEVPKNDQLQLAAAVAKNAVAAAVSGNNAIWKLYTGGIITSTECGTQVDHAVLIVGYDNSGPTPYWVVKNTWGSSFGENGYVRIAKSDKPGPGICGIASSASYPTQH